MIGFESHWLGSTITAISASASKYRNAATIFANSGLACADVATARISRRAHSERYFAPFNAECLYFFIAAAAPLKP